MWDNASAIKLIRLTTTNEPMSGAVNPMTTAAIDASRSGLRSAGGMLTTAMKRSVGKTNARREK
jgi:hypothetical protein